MIAAPACYGLMFPDIDALNDNAETNGKVFSVFVERLGVIPGRRTIRRKLDAWETCVQCDSYPTSYDLSMAGLLLKIGLATN